MVQHRTVSILGCGLMGISWGALFSAYGWKVIGWDPDARTRSTFAQSAVDRRSQVDAGDVAAGEISTVETVKEAVSGTAWAQECAPESPDLKKQLYWEIERYAPAETIIASSTSSLTHSQLAGDMDAPERLVTAHPFNPPHIMPLVEIFAAKPEIAHRTAELYRGLGRTPVILRKEAVGHIANRLSSALWREAVNIVAEGIADVSDVDAALVHGPGLRWSVVGAHLGYHLGGGPGGIDHYLAHLGPSQEQRWATLGTPALTPETCSRISEGVRIEAAGRSIEELEVQRDQALLAILRTRKAYPNI